MSSGVNDLIRTVAAVIRDPQGRVLLVRKRGTPTFIQPGGKTEPGEDALATLARELDEELGVAMRVDSALPLGEFEDVAVNETGRRVRAQAFLVEVDGEPLAGAEIEELAWVDPADPGPRPIAPLSRHQLLPLVARLWSPVQRDADRHYLWGGDSEGWHLLQRQDLSVIAERVPPGGAERRHRHARSRQFFYLLSGRAVIEMAGREVALAAGQGLEVPPGLPHRFMNPFDEDVHFLVVSMPTTRGDRVDDPA
jgi:8-oxo-dGTP diphosphatase